MSQTTEVMGTDSVPRTGVAPAQVGTAELPTSTHTPLSQSKASVLPASMQNPIGLTEKTLGQGALLQGEEHSQPLWLP